MPNLRLLVEFLTSHKANVSIMFAIATLPMFAFIGVAVDYGWTLNVKAKLDNSADSAALAGLAVAQSLITSGGSSSTAITNGQTAAAGYFKANIGSTSGTISLVNATVTQAGAVLTTTVSYSVTLNLFIMPIFGIKTVTFTNSATASATLPTYLNIHIVIDNSESMGIGATAADQQIVYNTSLGLSSGNAAYACAIACHFSSPSSADTTSTVRAAGATLRIDAAKKAVSDALSQIPSGSTTSVAIYTMSDQLTTVFPLSNNIAAAEPTSPMR